MNLVKFILILFLFNFQSLRGETCTKKSVRTLFTDEVITTCEEAISSSQPLKLVLEIKSSLGASWYCNKEDWQTILDDIKSGYTIPEIRVSRLIVDKNDQVLEYKYFVAMKKLGLKGLLEGNSKRQTYKTLRESIHYHDSPRLE